MRKYRIHSKPVYNTKTGRLIGHIDRYSDGTTAFIQAKRVPRGHCVNYGPQWAKG